MKTFDARFFTWFFSRIGFALVFVPKMQNLLFVPFLSGTAIHPVDPWSHWLLGNGRSDAFPYGPIMYLVLWPASILGKLITAITSVSLISACQILITSTLMILDFYMCRTIGAFSENRKMWSYICILAPLPLFINYVQGQLDIIPALLLLLSAQFITQHRWRKAGLFIGLAISAKFSLVLALPFLFLYFAFNTRQIGNAKQFLLGLIPGFALTLLPTLWSDGYRTMVMGTPEVLKSLAYSITFDNQQLLILPIAYFALFLWLWNQGKITPLLLLSFLGVALLIVASLQSSSIGWFYWGLPLVFGVLKNSSSRTLVLLLVWQIGVAGYFSLSSAETKLRYFGLVSFSSNSTFKSLLFTINFVVGIFLILKILAEAISQGDVFGVGKKPLAIAIAGDSGVGKDTLASAISNLFGESDTTILHGDDYHLHERGDASWRTTTHLDPEANNLQEWSRHFRKALNREKVVARQYDHSVGRFTTPREILPNELILLNGLHSHMISSSNEIDLKVFLSMDDDLRVSLKLRRDVESRGHGNRSQLISTINDRKPQFEEFVKPQELTSDLLIHLSEVSLDPLRLEVSVRTPNQTLVREIYRVLNSLTTVPSSLVRNANGELWLKVDPRELTALDNAEILSALVPNSDQIIRNSGLVDIGEKGFMATICIIGLANKRREKYANS